MADASDDTTPVAPATEEIIKEPTNEDVKDSDPEDFGEEAEWSEGEVVPDKVDPEAEPPAATDEPAKDDESEEVVKEPAKPEDEVEAESDDTTPVADTEAENKRLNDEMAKARIAERKARQEAETLRKKNEEATIERYLEDAGDDEIERERRELNVEGYRQREERIVITNERIQTGIEKAVASIDLFRTGSPAVQEELAASLDDYERMYVTKDKEGRAISATADVYQFLQAKAESIRRLTGAGARQQEDSKTKEQSRTFTPPVRPQKVAKADPEMEGFDEEANRY